jgi:hypothetical protein
MVVDEVTFAAAAGDPQKTGDGALAGSQDSADEQNFGVVPRSVAKERGKG